MWGQQGASEPSGITEFNFQLDWCVICGNGTVEPGEECDDGNVANGDCCSSSCQREPEESPCDNGSPCTSGDACDGNGTCVGSLSPGCRTAQKSRLFLKSSILFGRNKLVWKWLKGEATTQAEFGLPTGTTSYTLCLFAGTAEALIVTATIPAGGTGWSAISDKGYKYEGLGLYSDGIQKAILKGGAAGKAKVLVKGKGVYLPRPELGSGLPLPVTAQLLNNSNDVCFQGAYDIGDVIKNDGIQFKAKAQ